MDEYPLDLPAPTHTHYGSDEQMDADYALWLDNYEHAFVHTYEDTDY